MLAGAKQSSKLKLAFRKPYPALADPHTTSILEAVGPHNFPAKVKSTSVLFPARLQPRRLFTLLLSQYTGLCKLSYLPHLCLRQRAGAAHSAALREPVPEPDLFLPLLSPM